MSLEALKLYNLNKKVLFETEKEFTIRCKWYRALNMFIEQKISLKEISEKLKMSHSYLWRAATIQQNIIPKQAFILYSWLIISHITIPQYCEIVDLPMSTAKEKLLLSLASEYINKKMKARGIGQTGSRKAVGTQLSFFWDMEHDIYPEDIG